MKHEITEQLNKIAELKTKPFCYSCYTVAPTGRCSCCGSDDLMRILPGSGCEYGYAWVIKEILSEIESVDTEKRFEDSIRSCYEEETKIGWLKVDTVAAIKELDPISWNMAKNEWLDSEVEEENLLTFDEGSNYFEPYELQNHLEKVESELN